MCEAGHGCPTAGAAPRRPPPTTRPTPTYSGTEPIPFCADPPSPPEEPIDTATNKAVGFDVDIANAIAAKMGLKATIQTQDFSTIIPALLAKKGDAIMSAMSITPDRQKQVAFVGYFSAGQSILVKPGNPLKIQGVADLCGKRVAVQGTTTEQDNPTAANGPQGSSNKI